MAGNVGVPLNTEQSQRILGAPAIRHCHILNDRRYVLTKDTDENVALYDVLKACKVEDLGHVDFEQEIKKRNKMVYVPNWFNVDLKTGVCIIIYLNKYICVLTWSSKKKKNRTILKNYCFLS